MKNYIYTFLLLLIAGATACTSDNPMMIDQPDNDITPKRILHVTASTPTNKETRSFFKDPNTGNISFRWQTNRGDLNVYFRQYGVVLKEYRQVTTKEVSNDFEEMYFDVELPDEIDAADPFDLIGVCANNIQSKDGKILVDVSAHLLYDLSLQSSNREGTVPVYFIAENIDENQANINVNFNHLGAMAVTTIVNTSDKEFVTNGIAILPKDASKAYYVPGSLPYFGDDELSYIDVLNPSADLVKVPTKVVYPRVVIPPHSKKHLGFWMRPNGQEVSESQAVAYNPTTRQPIVAEGALKARKAFEMGKAYYIYTQWDGTKLTYLKEAPKDVLPEKQNYMDLTTSLKAGDKFFLQLATGNHDDQADVWVDLNNNGKREKGEYILTFGAEENDHVIILTVQGPNFRIYGNISEINCAGNETLTAIDVSKMPTLNRLSISKNAVKALDLSNNQRLDFIEASENEIASFKLADKSAITQLWLGSNNLKTIDISQADYLLGVDLSKNELTDINWGKTKAGLWLADISYNKLSADEINEAYNILPRAGQKLANWMYSIYVMNNPGSAKANHAIAKARGWTSYYKDDPTTSSVSTPAATAEKLLKLYMAQKK